LLPLSGHLPPNCWWGFLPFLRSGSGGIVVQKIIRHIDVKVDAGRKEILQLLGKISKIGMIIFGAITGLGTMGINVSALVAGLGLTGFALGFALKDVLSNLLSGVLILIYHPFDVADRIAVSGVEGVVTKIDLRYTTLQNEEKKILIPNSSLFTNTIKVLNKT